MTRQHRREKNRHRRALMRAGWTWQRHHLTAGADLTGWMRSFEAGISPRPEPGEVYTLTGIVGTRYGEVEVEWHWGGVAVPAAAPHLTDDMIEEQTVENNEEEH